ncbi:AAA family ATPase [Caldanaerobius polysaccharolyticus]|uniref:AAA family ATPase n=1 Tax=Caldanaerobius polysaccharolyticus TaxID=44256 RepID=UPI000689B7F5|nr:AAA family ATPase [Caldanaerobius polysaccharolyticus]
MLLKKVVLNNFQSHAHTEIEIAPTLTVIVGESDNGKSAIARAIRWVLFNEPRGSDFVRAGTAECSVSLVYDNGVSVTRVRSASGSKNRYVISRPGQEDRVFEGFGTSVPEEVVEITGVKKIRIDDDVTIDLHTSPQLEPPFLLMQSGSVKARAIGRLTGTDIFDLAHKKATQDFNKKREDLKKVSAELDQLEDSLKEYDDLPLLEDTLGKLKSIVATVDLLSAKIAGLCEKREAVKSNVEELQRVEDVIKDIGNIESVESAVLKADALYQRYRAVAVAKASMEDVAKGLSAADWVLRSTEQISLCSQRLSDMEVLVDKCRLVKGLGDRYKKCEKDLKVIDKAMEDMRLIGEADKACIKADDMRQRLASLVSARSKLEGLKEQLDHVNGFISASENISEVERISQSAKDALDRYAQMVILNERLKDVNRRIADAERELSTSERSLRELVARYEKLLRALKVCPVCFSPITDEKAHKIAHDMAG